MYTYQITSNTVTSYPLRVLFQGVSAFRPATFLGKYFGFGYQSPIKGAICEPQYGIKIVQGWRMPIS
jgi:hypothetical protein